MSEKMSNLYIERDGEKIYLAAKEAEAVYRSVKADYEGQDLVSKFHDMEQDGFDWFLDKAEAGFLGGKAKEAFTQKVTKELPDYAESIDNRLGKIDGYWDYYWQVVEDIVTELVEDAFAGVADNFFWICTDIEWDTDGEDPEGLGLPKAAAFEYGAVEKDDLADALSDEFGWCVKDLSFILGLKEDIPEGGVVCG